MAGSRHAPVARKLRWALCACVLALFAHPAGASAAIRYVDGTEPGGPGCGTEADPCKTIQEGVDAAVAGDTVQVAPGTYTEQVDIDKAITVDGASPEGGPDQTIVASPIAANLVDKFGGGDNRPVVFVHDVADPGAVTLQDLEVAGNSQGAAGFAFYGIAYVNAGGAISNVRVTHVRNTPADASDSGYAIAAFNPGGAPHSFDVLDSTVSDYQRQGITATNSGLTVDLSRNTATGRGLAALVVQSGISIGSGVTGTLADNAVHDHLCSTGSVPACGADLLNDEQAAGIRLDDVGAMTITGTTTPLPVSGATNDVGILDRNSDATRTFAHNALLASRYAGVFTNDGVVNANRNTVDGALQLGGNSDTGFAAASQTASNDPTLNLTGNTVVNADMGVSLFDDGGVATPTPDLTAHFNRIVDHLTAGLRNTTGASVNAENNWWGCNAGPGNSANCDVVSDTGPGDVDFNPWLVLRAGSAPRTIVVGDRSTIEGRLTKNSNGQEPANNRFPRTLLTFTTNNGDMEGGAPTGQKRTRNDAIARNRVTPDTPGTADVTVSLDNQTMHAPLITVLRAGPCANTQTGNNNPNTLNGTLAGDRLIGLGADDLLRGRRGRDCLLGGTGADRLQGGDHHDVLEGDAGEDQLIGGDGPDDFLGGNGPDHINANDGVSNEPIDCGGGVDRVRSDPGDDEVNCEFVVN